MNNQFFIGSIFATFWFHHLDTKMLMCTVTALEGLSLLLFTLYGNFYFLIAMRFLTGFCQVFISIYMPVWADTFGSTERVKTIWLNMLLFGSTIGVLLGYILCASLVTQSISWRYAFYTQSLCFVVPLVGMLIAPSSYFDIEGKLTQSEE
jgi:predicted MFS family arabinose efflux permease